MNDDFTRRQLLKAGIGLFATSFRPPAADITSTLASYMGDAAARRLPDEVIERTKQIVLDTFAAMISGSDLPPGRFAIQFVRGYKGEKISTVAGSKIVCGPI